MEKEFYDIIMKKANGSLKIALIQQLQSDISCTTEEADKAIDHLFDIIDAHKKFNNLNK